MAPERLSGRALEPGTLRRSLGAFATGVTLVTVGGRTPHGMTANSFTSVSLDPPLVLVCVDRGALMHASLESHAHFGLSVLSSRQEPVARHFADRRRPLGAAQFDTVDWFPGRATGVPLIRDALVTLECAVWRGYAGGDHTIYVGRLLTLTDGPEAEALLFHAGRFRQLSHTDSSGVAT
ncbi:flavin reductase family protein [Streptomyces sedi]|uniref:Flavin reductase family protein n=1 Tax=Streptomyces sedi TaxID=555059 RepID=A0A5C4VEK2_9ACTN|nr:flavin reductase family protein [Streptomyces sedi]TNM34323.1 flavin reductase family protein [Streptomyces sedi]